MCESKYSKQDVYVGIHLVMPFSCALLLLYLRFLQIIKRWVLPAPHLQESRRRDTGCHIFNFILFYHSFGWNGKFRMRLEKYWFPPSPASEPGFVSHRVGRARDRVSPK